MKYIRIKNQGQIELEALTLLGASTKRNDSTKIGRFGSGNKYALAYLMKNNYEVVITSGSKTFNITTIKKEFRDNSFDVIVVDDKETSITTDLGPDWTLWQAIRELYSNAIDEGEHSLEYVNNISNIENETHFYIRSNSEINKFVSDFNLYFAQNKTKLYENKKGVIYKKDSENVNLYRKGIRCYDQPKKSIFDYDIPEISLNESRIANHPWTLPGLIWNIIFSCTDKAIIKEFLSGEIYDQDHIEFLANDDYYASASYMTKEFKEVASSLQIAPSSMSGLVSLEERGRTVILPDKAFNLINLNCEAKVDKSFKTIGFESILEFIPNEVQYATMNKAIDFFEQTNYVGPLSYELKCCYCVDKHVKGLADKQNKIIYITDIGLEKGVKEVVNTMIEEYIHIKYNCNDETRAFQTASINELVSSLMVNNSYLL